MNQKKRLKLNIVSKYRTPIYGFAILWIALFHGGIDYVDYSFGFRQLSVLKTVMDNGNVGVEMFLFLSGISLYFSMKKDSNLLSYIEKRTKRIFIPLLLVDGFYFIISYFIIEHKRSKCINSFLLLEFWETGDQTTWFISLIFVLYIIYPYIYHFIFEKDSSASIWLRGALLMLLVYLAIICFARVNGELYSSIEIAITRIPVFIFGSIFGKYVYEGKEISYAWIVLIAALVVVFFAVIHMDILHGYERRFFFLIGGLPLTYLVALLFDVINRITKSGKLNVTRFFNMVGKASLEFYLSQIIGWKIYNVLPIDNKYGIISWICMLVPALAYAVLINRIEKKFRLM